MSSIIATIMDKKTEVVFFSSTAIALYGYDQGMMSLINTNYSYLDTMGISGDDPLVGIIVSVYYLGCAVGAVGFSIFADKAGRKPSIFTCAAIAALGNFLMFIAGIGDTPGALVLLFVGRIVMGLGVGGFDSVIPTYSSELNSDGGRGKALAKEFQSNIFGLNMAFGINLGVTQALGKGNQWAWRIPIIAMQVYPLILLAFVFSLPESPRWFVFHQRKRDAKQALEKIYGEKDAPEKFDELVKAHEEESSHNIGWNEMIWPGSEQWHQTAITIMGQVNQALTGYGAVSVYGPQIFELLGLGVTEAEHITQGNYISYFFLMTFAWLLIDRLGRRALMVWGGFILAISFILLTLLGGLAQNEERFKIQPKPIAIVGSLILFIATGSFGIGWLTQPWLIPTEIYPATSRARGASISVVIWGIANFVVTLLTPILFNTLSYWLFLIFAVTNIFAAWWTYVYNPETGGRTFEENQEFFEYAKKEGSWSVRRVDDGSYMGMPPSQEKGGQEDGERQPLLGSS